MAGNIGGSSEGDDDMISGINVTPLVDITLVLLIIFMVTASYIIREAIQVDLPRAAHGGEAVGTSLAVVLTDKGDIYLDGVKRDENQLRELTRQAIARDKDTRAVISADRRSLHGEVVRIIDIVKGEGIAKFAINIEKEP